MSANQINVRRKELPKTGWSKFHLTAIFAVVVLLGAIFTVAVVSYSGGFNYRSSAPLEVAADGNRQIIRVPKGGNLQEAVSRAKSGDVIELAGGAIYNEITLPKKDLTDFVTIQTAQIRQLPENVRVSPKQVSLMAKIITRGGGKSAVSTEAGAHHFRFVGIEFAPATAEYTYNLVNFGTESNNLTDVPHDLEIDRSYIHSGDRGKTRRGLALNSANTIVKNSYFEGFAFPQEETQGICGWTGTKNVKILNNYVEGGAENVMFGGSDPARAELIPQDIEVRGNHFNKPFEWKDKNSIKCLFELKNARRVQFIGNFLENNWIGAAFRITIRNQDGKADFSTVEDVLIKDNIVNGAGEGINVLGKDDTNKSQTLKNLTVTDNLFLNLGGENFAGSGYFMQIADGENILVANNTVFNSGNIITFYGTQPRSFLFRDNITNYGEYGIHGIGDVRTVAVQRLFQNNLFINNRKIPASDFIFPPNNFSVQDIKDAGFADFAKNNFSLTPTSKFKGKGKDKNDLGSNMQVNSAK